MYVALNPKRADQRLGSFSVNLRTGRWADFATGDKGGDPISLAAFLAGLSQVEAARRLATMLGLEADDVASAADDVTPMPVAPRDARSPTSYIAASPVNRAHLGIPERGGRDRLLRLSVQHGEAGRIA